MIRHLDTQESDRTQSTESQGQQSPRWPQQTTRSRKQQARAEAICEKVNQFWKGAPINVPVCGTIRLTPDGYAHLVKLLHEDSRVAVYAFHRMHLCYDRELRQLAYEMPTTIHDEVRTMFLVEIDSVLKGIENASPTARTVLSLVAPVYGSEYCTPTGIGSMSQEQYQQGGWIRNYSIFGAPCFVLEICFAQRFAAVCDKIRNAMHTRLGRPGMAIIINIRYSSPHQLRKPQLDLRRDANYTIYQWREGFGTYGARVGCPECIVQRQQFRDRSGGVVPGKLSFTVGDFIGKETWSRLPECRQPDLARTLAKRVKIDHSVMAGWLDRAEYRALEAATLAFQ